MPSTARTAPSGPTRTPSRISPVAGSSSVSCTQSAIDAASPTCPPRASRIAAGPLAGAFLKSSPRRHQIPPPPSALHPSRNCTRDRAQRRTSRAPSQGPGALHREAEPGDVVVVVVGPRAEVAQPHGAGDRRDRVGPFRARGAQLGVDEAVEQVGLPPVVPRPRLHGREPRPADPADPGAGDDAAEAAQVPADDGALGRGGPRGPVDVRDDAAAQAGIRRFGDGVARTPVRRPHRSLHHVAPLRARAAEKAVRASAPDHPDPRETDSVASPSRRLDPGIPARRPAGVTTRWTDPRARVSRRAWRSRPPHRR